MKYTICELFAGVGGFRVGFEKSSSDWKTVWANQWEPSKKVQHAFECYRSHFETSGGINEFSNIDISQVPEEHIPGHTVLVGGFPCQDYSVASTGAKGIQGKKGVLWWEIERILKAKRPPFMILENVDRLLKSPSKQRGRDFGIIISCLAKLGYSVEWRVINAAEYGFQQRRRRTFIFAVHNTTNYYEELNKQSVYEELQHAGFFSSIFNIETFKEEHINSIDIKEKYDLDILEISNNFTFEFKNSGIYRNGLIYTVETTPSNLLAEHQLTLRDILEEHVDEKYILSEGDLEKWTYLKGPKAIERTSKDGHKYTFREGGIAFPDPIDKPARTMLTSEASKNRSTHVVSDIETGKLRILTPLECERINGFPDNWTNTGMTQSFRYFCMGNALVVNLIENMGRKLHKIVSNEGNKYIKEIAVTNIIE
ncbi:DNA-cytosine methyltransferase family protein [Clostridium botulinum B str. Eklund 17B (NRP)]|uniref:DNA (cytosine-5-)-methyltransferase n=1 Tax=Clostridium botulinum (strain Eklund 17B / Type B) TaxID=935198 RepID=B2TKK8_CLOBB|nr:DNA-cytosine methyltransferase family protein [Clostridium botulinum B str. Eklund 17B (NRP)]MBY6976484.1 DNA (cytosine-5-)-methyltransferase [Clostridium botulinum]MBY7001583.1 DNA (cytosine-5-)-methyltransferase [Clostridium botulinum]MCR1274420.1 DNA (cytosine-5-)-methyltransferase [Clostridium botulinum]CDH89532.1 DNA-cytosine methyltransferase [Clostridium botulinum B str. Eklund 17B (NRP)]